ncbi:trimeric intracellular cation channel family protein [Arcticibacterium luteifluviistationis]|uniref:Glycine transporter domain-containing protein n=1 Tax=Arcticibacterium luteifluviistationis TaxID=1784714 RepID=A0A2Z4GBN6_9BACT|nr:trimeric intracellular cation channel family protein [Arcticibacterium luteifluviistationis]AWV98343.1 hypothetical protein DJ013_09230 [Arcticibacterium luteifluviistationis]
MNWIYFFEILGTVIFVISGVMTAIDDDFDVVGSIIIGIVTAVGGGTVRDVLIGQTPVGWMRDTSFLWAMLAGVILSYLFRKYITKLRRSMFFFDTMGIGLFTILGLQKTLNAGLEVPFAVLMGIVSAVFGGVIRDVLTNRVPLIFRKEIYATACLVGALVFLALEQFNTIRPINMGVSMLVVMIIRYLSVKNNWGLKL